MSTIPRLRIPIRFKTGELLEPRDEDLIDASSLKHLCGNDTIKIKMVTKEGQTVLWRDIINKKYPVSDIITVITQQDGNIKIYTEEGRVF